MARILLLPAYDVSMTGAQALAAAQHGPFSVKFRVQILNALNPREKLDKSERRFFVDQKPLPWLCSA
ncbi:hypothetical protein [Caulobacter sp. RL271]|uniref:Glycosyltransferase n=1 Tax=Caulobacter segnis TaxID=88688 RepID=A0ABY4ZRI4_9CAUL|nr:hypothetical protein [Caulobacter segnis]USQ94989.1 hypothetical protein MZV50_20875 [Caulobacter segnis]